MKKTPNKRSIGALCILSTLFLAFSGSAPTMRTGAPGDNGTCQNCHSNNGSFSGDINLIGIPSSLAGNETIDITAEIAVTSGSPMEAGFSMVVIDDTNENNAGTWISGDGGFTSSGGREYWGHQPAISFSGGTAEWAAEWEAPNITDDVTFYICAVLANGTGGTGGDIVECTSLTVMPYSYEWDNGEDTAIATNLDAGNHSVTVTDDNGTMAMASIFIGEPNNIDANEELTDVSCFGDDDGSIELFPSGGTGTFDCEWATLGTGCEQFGLEAGEYFVTITDSNDCIEAFTFEILASDPLELNMSSTDASTASASDGTASVNVSGGTPGYNYEWSNGGSSSTITGLTPGNYEVTVTDDNGCEEIDNVDVTGGPCLLSVNAMVTDLNCFDDNSGMIGLAIVGAIDPVDYLWSDNSTDPSLRDVPAGTYGVTVTDAGGCTQMINGLEITQPDSLALNLISLTNVECDGDTDGSIIVEFMKLLEKIL